MFYMSLAAFSPVPVTIPNCYPLSKLLISAGDLSSYPKEKSKSSRQLPILSPSNLLYLHGSLSPSPTSSVREVSLLLKLDFQPALCRPFPGTEGPFRSLVPSTTISYNFNPFLSTASFPTDYKCAQVSPFVERGATYSP